MDREKVFEAFDKMDIGNTGYLNGEDFHHLMNTMCSPLFIRLAVQWSITLLGGALMFSSYTT